MGQDQFIDHEFRAGNVWRELVSIAAERRLTTYGEIGDRVGIHHRAVRYALGPIQDHCMNLSFPPLTALVVNKSTGKQGGGYIAGSKNNQKDIERVFNYDWGSVQNVFPQMEAAEVNKLSQRLLADPKSAKEVFRLIRSRGAAQQIFRSAVLEAYEHQCAVCSTSFLDLLEAAHIIPWALAKPHVRIDPRNGILLCANHHRLFDSNWINISRNFRLEFFDPQQIFDRYSSADMAGIKPYIGKKIRLPRHQNLYPSKSYLDKRASEFLEEQLENKITK